MADREGCSRFQVHSAGAGGDEASAGIAGAVGGLRVSLHELEGGPGTLVQSVAVPKPDSSLSAVVVSGGKQYRVAPGDKILVDRLTAEPGSSLKLGRVLLFNDGKDIKVGNPAIDGLDVEAKVLAHSRGPRIDVLRYKSKKRVRVHRGARADLTALEIIAVGGIGVEKETKTEAQPKGKAKASPKKAAAPKAEAVSAEAASTEVKAESEEKKEAPKRTVRRSTKEAK